MPVGPKSIPVLVVTMIAPLIVHGRHRGHLLWRCVQLQNEPLTIFPRARQYGCAEVREACVVQAIVVRRHSNPDRGVIDDMVPPERVDLIAGESQQLAGHLQGPDVLHDEQRLNACSLVTGASLDWVRERFPLAVIRVLYIPSVASCYAWTSDLLSVEPRGSSGDRIAASRIGELSDRLYTRVREVASSRDIEVLDARGVMRDACRTHALHGPLDWYHFNQRGCETLGKFLAPLFEDSPSR